MRQLNIFDYKPSPPHNGTPASKAAAESVVEHLGRLEAIVLDCIAEAGPDGRTGDEIEVITGMAHQTVGPRLVELRRSGFVRQAFDPETGEAIKRPTRSGRLATVWVATEATPCAD